jgi:hypothetical protein
MSQFPQGQQVQQPQQQWGQPAPQQQFQQPPFQGAQGTFAPGQFQQPQPQGFVPQQGQQQAPQLQRVMLGQGYAQGQFPFANEFHGIGQIFPNQWMPAGFEVKPGQNGGTGSLQINVKIREAWGDQPNQVKIQFMRLVIFGAAAQSLANTIRAGMLIEFNGQFRPNKYLNKRTNQTMSVNQIILNTRQGAMPFRVVGELPMYDEVNPNNQRGGGGWNNGGQPQGAPSAQGGWGAPQQQAPQQAPQQQFQQPPAQQQFQQPPQQNFQQQPPAQQAPQQQFAPQQAPQGWGQPAGGFAPQQQTHPAMGVPAQPAPGQMQGNFAPPPQGQPQGAPQAQPGGFMPPPVQPPF